MVSPTMKEWEGGGGVGKRRASPPPSSSSSSTFPITATSSSTSRRRGWCPSMSTCASACADSALPLFVLTFALILTALAILGAQNAYMGPMPSGSNVKGNPTSAAAAGGGAGVAQGKGAEGEGEEGGGAGESGGVVRTQTVYSAPFLSDLLPESEGSRKRKVPLSEEEEELAKAEAKYKNNLIRRSEMMQGWRPKPPFRRWNAGRIREVFLTPTYPCAHPQHLGSKERGKWVCNLAKLKEKPVTVYTFGALEDLSFEAALYREVGEGAMIHVFSPYLSAKEERRLMAPKSEARKFLASYHPIGVSTQATLRADSAGAAPGKQFLTFPEILEKMHDTRIDILKIDCEGCELALFVELASTYTRDNPPFSQVIVELHQARQPGKTLPVVFALEDLGFRLFHVEPDRGSSQRYELSFVHERFLYPASLANAIGAGMPAGIGAGTDSLQSKTRGS